MMHHWLKLPSYDDHDLHLTQYHLSHCLNHFHVIDYDVQYCLDGVVYDVDEDVSCDVHGDHCCDDVDGKRDLQLSCQELLGLHYYQLSHLSNTYTHTRTQGKRQQRIGKKTLLS